VSQLIKAVLTVVHKPNLFALVQ